MGRKKLELKARETREGKQVTFSKRRMGLEKKAQQLSTLCDIPLLLLLFSPGHRLSWISGSRSTPEEVLKQYADIPFEERNRRKIEVLEQLSRAFRKSNHKVNMEEFFRQTSATPSIQDLLACFQRKWITLLQKLRESEMPKSLEHACQIEEILQIRLQQIQMHRQPLMELTQCIAPYNQALPEQQPLPVSSQCIVGYNNETFGQERCSQDLTNCGTIDVTSQEAWEVKYLPPVLEHDSIPLLAHQGVPDFGPSCLPSSSTTKNSCLLDTLDQFGKQPMHLPTCPDHMFHQNGDIHQESTIFERDANYDPFLCDREDHFFPSGSLLGDGDLCTSNNLHHPRSCRFQPSFEYEDVKPLNLAALDMQKP